MRNRTAEASKAVRKAAKKEQELVRQGKGTRDWTPSQQKDILARGRAYDDNGVAFDGHHMKSVEAYPEYQGDPDNIQFLSKEEHKAAHQGSFLNSSNGYYDPQTGLILDFGEDRFIPCKVVKLSEPLPEDIVRSLTKKESKATNSVNETIRETGTDGINPNDHGCNNPFNGETAGHDELCATIKRNEQVSAIELCEPPAPQDNKVDIPESHNQSSTEINQNRSNQEETPEPAKLRHRTSDSIEDRSIISSITNAFGKAKSNIMNTFRTAKEKYIEVKSVFDENPELKEALREGAKSLWDIGTMIGGGVADYVDKKNRKYSTQTSYSTEEWLSDSCSESEEKTPSKEREKAAEDTSPVRESDIAIEDTFEKGISEAEKEAPESKKKGTPKSPGPRKGYLGRRWKGPKGNQRLEEAWVSETYVHKEKKKHNDDDAS